MRIGANYAPPFRSEDEANRIVQTLQTEVLIAAVDSSCDSETLRRYRRWVDSTGLEIAEVGVWNNPLDPQKREKNIVYAQKQLALADELGALCCVNISGSRGAKWDGYDPANTTDETFDMVVETVRTIIDGVNPTRTYYTLEPMPWAFPSSPDEYLRLIRAVDRKAFAVHLDFANMMNSLDRYRNHEAFLDECFAKLGPHIRSIHIKDVGLLDGLPCMLAERMPGEGGLNLRNVLRRVNRLGGNLPVLVEHLEGIEQYRQAMQTILRMRAEC